MTNLGNVVAIDPGARYFAYAIYHRGELTHAGYSASDRVDSIPLIPGNRYEWIMEKPRKYRAFEKAHADLDRLLATLKRIKKLADERDEVVTEVAPSAWKGQVPKKVHHERLWPRYTKKEQAVLVAPPGTEGYAHDVHDASALGAGYIGRVGRGGTECG